MTELDISSEQSRAYHYPEGVVLTIDDPDILYVLESGSHRVTTKGGRTFRPKRGWIGISWMPREGAPAFVA